MQEGRDKHREEDDVEEIEAVRNVVDHGERRQHHRHSPAKTGPAQGNALPGSEPLRQRDEERRQRPCDEYEDERQRRALDGDVSELVGKDEKPEREEHRDLRDPCKPVVEGGDRALGGDRPAPEHQTGQIDGEEPGAVQRVRRAERQRGDRERRDRIEPARRQPHPLECLYPEPAGEQPDCSADRDLAGEKTGHVDEPIVRLLDPVDEAQDEEHRDRVVQAGFALERSRQPSPERRAAKHGKDRRPVGRRKDRSEQQSLQRRQVEEPGGGEARDHGGPYRPDEGEAKRRTKDRSNLLESGCETALEEDERQSDRPDRACQLVVVEVDPSLDVGAGKHPEAQEQDESGHSDAPGQKRRQQAECEESAPHQDQFAIAHRRNDGSSREVPRVAGRLARAAISHQRPLPGAETSAPRRFLESQAARVRLRAH